VKHFLYLIKVVLYLNFKWSIFFTVYVFTDNHYSKYFLTIIITIDFLALKSKITIIFSKLQTNPRSQNTGNFAISILFTTPQNCQQI
jgi:hypothetical protein